LLPAGNARFSSDDPRLGIARESGVVMTVRAGGWTADPPNLSATVLPVHVTLENRGTHPLRVSHQEFRFRGLSLDYLPLPPRKLVGREVEVKTDPMLVPQTPGPGFHAAPGRIPPLPGFDPWRLPWQDDQYFYSRQYAKWTVALPTVDMIRLSLPEGVLDPGAQVDGYLYFERLNEAVREPRFVFDLVDARSGLTFGTIQVPFVRR
jgi:hypothetical protein